MKYLLFIMLFAIRCEKEEPTPRQHLDEEIHDYTIFPKGSWWVYQIEGSEHTDTLKILANTNEIVYDLDVTGTYYQRVYVKKYYSGMKAKAKGIASAQYMIYDRCEYWGTFLSDTSTYRQLQYISGLASADTVSEYNHNFIMKKTVNGSVILNGVSYHDVVIFSFQKLNVWSKQYHVKKNLFFAKGVGLIKEEDIENNKTWNLIDYHINN